MTKFAYFVAGVILLLVIAVAGINWMRPTVRVSADSKSIFDKTEMTDFDVKTLEIAEIKIDGDFLEVNLKNTSVKDVDGFTLLFDDKSTVTADYTMSGDVISPGGEKKLKIPRDSAKTPAAENITYDRPFFKIVAVVFTDRTDEGVPHYIAGIKNRRRGVKKQLENIIPDLDKLTTTDESVFQLKVKDIKRRIDALSVKADEESDAFQQGLIDGKEDLLKVVENIGFEQREKRADFSDFRQFLERKIDKTRARIGRL